MNGFNSGAFRQALTDAVLEEYGEVPAAPRASKRGKGNSIARAVRYAVLAAILLVTAIGSVLASVNVDEPFFPAKEAESIHYEKKMQHAMPKTEIVEIYCPKNVPFRFKRGDIWISKEVVDISWVADDNGDFISFQQFPLHNFGYNDPEKDPVLPEEIKWEKRMINGFEVIIFYDNGLIKYWWNDGEYFFAMEFHCESSTENERYRIFNSIAVDEALSARSEINKDG